MDPDAALALASSIVAQAMAIRGENDAGEPS